MQKFFNEMQVSTIKKYLKKKVKFQFQTATPKTVIISENRINNKINKKYGKKSNNLISNKTEIANEIETNEITENNRKNLFDQENKEKICLKFKLNIIQTLNSNTLVNTYQVAETGIRSPM